MGRRFFGLRPAAVFLVFAAALLVVLFSGCPQFPVEPAKVCGNQVIEEGENCENCPQDAGCLEGEDCVEGVCVDLCGNGEVDAGEDCSTCQADVKCEEGKECAEGACVEICGNGKVDAGENCGNCPQDAGCGQGAVCENNECVELCGNGKVDEGEDCSTCQADVKCAQGKECKNGVCALKDSGSGERPVRQAYVEMTVNTKTKYYVPGEIIYVEGGSGYEGRVFSIEFFDVVSTGADYLAKFYMYDEQGEKLDSVSAESGSDLFFFDSQGTEIILGSYLRVNGVYAPA